MDLEKFMGTLFGLLVMVSLPNVEQLIYNALTPTVTDVTAQAQYYDPITAGLLGVAWMLVGVGITIGALLALGGKIMDLFSMF